VIGAKVGRFQMGAKCTKGQRVRIVSLRDEQLKAKHPMVEECASQTGVIIECHWYGISESHRPVSERPRVKGHHIYDVCLDRDRKIIRAVPEDALEPLA
jgi:hypothetical protein